jgi:hypothetical protein
MTSIDSRLERVEKLLDVLVKKDLLQTYNSLGFGGDPPKSPESMEKAICLVNDWLYPIAVQLGYTGRKDIPSLRDFFRGTLTKEDGVWNIKNKNGEYSTVDRKIRYRCDLFEWLLD